MQDSWNQLQSSKKKYEYGGYIILYMEMALSLTNYVKLISIFKTPLTLSHFKSQSLW